MNFLICFFIKTAAYFFRNHFRIIIEKKIVGHLWAAVLFLVFFCFFQIESVWYWLIFTNQQHFYAARLCTFIWNQIVEIPMWMYLLIIQTKQTKKKKRPTIYTHTMWGSRFISHSRLFILHSFDVIRNVCQKNKKKQRRIIKVNYMR